MALSLGTRLGVYEIVAPLGAGGMGEVYRARDTRPQMDRTVAIKVLPASLSGDPELRERFDREARAIASLNHPHICALYDVGQVPSDERPSPDNNLVRFLVLEYLEGQTLAQRLTGGPLPPADALRYAIEISDALDKAHRSGIVHRDLKPANVMLTKAGAKLLDFGLAKSATPAVAVSGLSMLPTTPPNLTAQGTILGTFQYMAPEQIEGLEADARTDIFAFGALLFEMLTGRPAFEGKTRASLLGAILKDEPPPVSRVQPVVPAAIDRIISTCLAKDPDDRYQSARDLLRDLKWVASGSSDGAAAQTVTMAARSNRVAWLVAVVSLIALIATAVAALRPDGAPAPDPVQFTIAAPDNTSFGGPLAGGTGVAAQIAVSPDGRNIVFVAGAPSSYQIWLRPLSTAASRPIQGTEGGTFPFWSPDGRFIGFFADGKLKKVAIAGGPPVVLTDAATGRGGSWSRDNVIVFDRSVGMGLFRVASAGGVPESVTTLADGEDAHRWPHFLPDGRHFFYTAVTGACCPPTKPGTIKIGSLDQAESPVTLVQVDSSAAYASGHLVFARDQTLMAQPFDPVARQLTGDTFPLTERVNFEGSRYVSASVSANGTLVYAHGGSPNPQQLTWFDRTGRILSTLGEAAPDVNLALSRDERQVAVAQRTGSPENLDIWTIDIARNLRSRRTSDPQPEGWPVWSPDATRIVFEAGAPGLGGGLPEKGRLRQTFINGTAANETLLEAAGTPSRPCGERQCRVTPTDWSADGRFVLYTLIGSFPATSDIWALPLFGDRQPIPVAQTSFTESLAVFSPNGRWIAYTTDETGEPNVYVQSFPGGAGKSRVSQSGGRNPRWRADGKELFYLGLDGTMMAVPVVATDQFETGVPQALFPARAINNANQMYVVTRDGQRFLVNARPPQNSGSAEPLTAIINWPVTIQK